jgi:hypothetical protein
LSWLTLWPWRFFWLLSRWAGCWQMPVRHIPSSLFCQIASLVERKRRKADASASGWL